MRNKYIRFLDHHGISDGVLRELVKGKDICKRQAIASARDGVLRRQKEIEALLTLREMLETSCQT